MLRVPVIVSDRVGAARDLVAPVRPSFIYPCGDVAALAATLRTTIGDRALLQSLRRAVVAQVQTWSPAQNIAATMDAIRIAVSRLGRRTAQSLPNSTAAHTASQNAAPASQKLHE